MKEKYDWKPGDKIRIVKAGWSSADEEIGIIFTIKEKIGGDLDDGYDWLLVEDRMGMHNKRMSLLGRGAVLVRRKIINLKKLAERCNEK